MKWLLQALYMNGAVRKSYNKLVNNQFSVMTRFGKLMSTETMLRLYKAYILPHFYYCSIVWIVLLEPGKICNPTTSAHPVRWQLAVHITSQIVHRHPRSDGNEGTWTAARRYCSKRTKKISACKNVYLEHYLQRLWATLEKKGGDLVSGLKGLNVR